MWSQTVDRTDDRDEPSVFESRQELAIGAHLPPGIFERMYIKSLIRRTDTGGWLYELGLAPPKE